MENQGLSEVFQIMLDKAEPKIVELQNNKHIPVGALYLDKIKYDQIIVSETDSDEKYFLLLDGIGIYFTYYKILSKC